jgi:hypothetical protein
MPMLFTRTRKNFDATLVMMLILASAGCAASKGGVPTDAQLVTERSAGIGFEAPESGTAYITNKSNGKLVYATPMNRRDRLMFHPPSKRITLNGTVVKEDDRFDPKQIHRLYFLKG